VIAVLYSLITKSQNNWKSRVSGEMDKLNQSALFETENEYGFPEVSSSKNFRCKDLIPFHQCKKMLAGDKDKAVSFFLDDYKFEQVWTRPRDFIRTFQYYGNIISPTFSIWSNQPYALNLFNMYRSRWCTKFYQEFGINVLVDCRWSDESTYDLAFSGIEKGSPVIVNTVGTRYLENRKMFVDGFEEMMKRIEPKDLYIYGEYIPVDLGKYTNDFDSVILFESFWKKQRDKINSKLEVRRNGS
jgi:gene 1 protein